MLIEALTKDENPNIRAYAAKGLAMFGPSTFRSLLLGLHDNSPLVRKAAASAVAKHFSAEMISDEFWDKVSQRQSILCTVKELLESRIQLPQSCALLFQELLELLDQEFRKESLDSGEDL